MWRGVVLLILMVWGGSADAACPGLSNADKHLFLSARQLVTPKAATVRAGGTVLLAYCETIPGSGNIPFDPSVSVYYTADRKRMDLELRTEGACDTVLLVRTPSGRWFFDDDNGGERNARLRLSAPPEGRYEIWVGSQGGEACGARLVLQTFRSNVKLARSPAPRRIAGRI
jgi:hypothetical protein